MGDAQWALGSWLMLVETPQICVRRNSGLLWPMIGGYCYLGYKNERSTLAPVTLTSELYFLNFW